MHTLLVLKTGRTFPELATRRGDFEDWFSASLARSAAAQYHRAVRVLVADAQADGELPALSGIDGVLVTGSPATVHDREPWSVRAGQWLAAAVVAGAPVLGVCYGHQLLADSSGGRSGTNSAGREIGVTEVEVHSDDLLFAGLPPRFPVLTSHCDAVLAAPPHGRVLASNAHTAIQALAFSPRARTVQWHPEFDADIMRYYLTVRAPFIDVERGAGTTTRLLAELREVPSGPVILANFIRHFV